MLHNGRSNEGDSQCYEINRQLESQEALDIVINVTTPLGSSHDSFEVVIGNDNVSGFNTNVRSRNSHTKSNICLLESWGIVSTVTCDSNDITLVT